MEDIRNFVTERLARKKAGEAEDTVPAEGVVQQDGKIKKVDIDTQEGKSARSNISGGKWAIKPPLEEEEFDINDPDNINNNTKKLLAKFRAEEDFLCLGRAGWAKTAIIEAMSAKYKRSVITVYLDKIMASDLGGIPVPTRGKSGVAQQELAMPGWAAYMYEHPDEQFLLFFDEMNQAAPDVMNALMPIVLKHEICGHEFDNFFVGAAGNLEEENRGGVSALSGPLASRFKPIIYWETNTPETWKSAFKYLHKTWDESLGKSYIDKFEDAQDAFENPRELDKKLFKFVYKLVASGEDNSIFDSNYYYDRIRALAQEQIDRTQDDKLKQLAEATKDLVDNGPADMGKGKKKPGRTREMVDPELVEQLKDAIELGFLVFDGVHYGVSRENVHLIVNPNDIPAETRERYIEKWLEDGLKFKYQKDAEFVKDGLQKIE